MTETEMFDAIRLHMRKGVPAIEAMHKVLLLAGSDLLPFCEGETHVYVRCNEMPIHSINTVFFLANSQFLKCRIVAFNSELKIPYPYIHIYV